MEEVSAVVNVMQSTIDSINLLHSQLHGGEAEVYESNTDYSVSEFWKKLEDVAKVVSHECTKISLMYSQPPYPDTNSLDSLLSGLEGSVVGLVAVFYKLPKSEGTTLKRHVHKTVMFILECIHSMLCDIKSLSHSQPSHKQLECVGRAWEACDRVRRLPRNNKDACLCIVRREMGLVVDAVDELQQEIGNYTESWSNKDKELLPSCVGLVKTAKNLLKKIEAAVMENGSSESDASIAQLDDVAEFVKAVSPAVDDFVLSTYPPVRKEALLKQADVLSGELTEILQKLEDSNITQEKDKQWLDFLNKAVFHNRNKLTQLINNINT